MSLTLGQTDQRSPLAAILVAAAVMVAVLVTLYFTTWRKVADLIVAHTDVFAPVTVMKQTTGGPHVIGSLGSTESDVYVIATIHQQDNMTIPMFYDGASASMDDATGASLDARVVDASELPRLEQSFPQLAALVSTPLAVGDTFGPKSARDGKIVLLFPGLTQDLWKKKKSATLTVRFAHQQPMTVAIP